MLRFTASLDSTNNSRTHTEREAREKTTDVQQTSEQPRAPLDGWTASPTGDAATTNCPACNGAGHIRLDELHLEECVFCQ